jgi:hypothetical protein
MRNEHFFIVIYHSSLAKAAVNVCAFVNCAVVLKKTPQFLIFSMVKGGPSAQ